MLARDLAVKRICEMLGHSMITLTLHTYSHLIPSMQGDAAAATDAMLSA